MSSDSPQQSASSFLLPVWTLWWREVVRFFRQKNRVIGALGTPIVFWLLFGLGLQNSFRPPPTKGVRIEAGGIQVAADVTGRVDYLEYFYPGTLILILLFASIFSTISIIEDRREGFLQGVLVSPAPLSALVLGKILGGTTVGLVQALLMLALLPFLGLSLHLSSALLTAGMLFLCGFGLTGLGFVIAWKMDSVAGFHAIMNLLLMPMWLLSGAFFPASGAHPFIRGIMVVNPLTYGLAGVRRSLYGLDKPMAADVPSMGVSVAVALGFAAVMFIGTSLVASSARRK